MKRIMMTCVVAGLFSTASLAQGFDQNKAYVGGGLGLNSLTGWDDAIGFQIFGGYQLDMVPLGPFSLAVEVGYMDSGTFEHDLGGEGEVTGLWANAVFSLPINNQVRLLGRAGQDFGDDDGFMVGVGAEFSIAPRFDLRGEYVTRDNVDSLQANIVYRF